ncbi:MAG: DUF1684 domain-containing protein [Flavobacteriales bacterium]|nr:DUF1684 domain-containing protein [Flavobacteriales bacterium]HRH68361.1 DUF1684 domain-containing protein [Flavobacteriales bacterium]
MRTIIFAALCCTWTNGSAQIGDAGWRKDLDAFWAKIDSAYSDSLHSPLPKEERKGFVSLHRFAADPKFRVKATFTAQEGPVFGMKTTSQREPKYQSIGTLRFVLDGKEEQLTVYRNIDLSRLPDYVNYLFIPFTDLTNGETTYGGGRYLDLEGPLGTEVDLDFNRAYNPYCAYGGAYSCPIPPLENHLEVAIRAGVLKHHD